MIEEFHDNPKNRSEVEDQLASLSGLNRGDVVIYCPESNMASKYANMLVEWREKHIPLSTIDDASTKQALQAIMSAHDLLWGLQVFAIPSVKQNARTEQTLRSLCQWKFSPVSLPKDRDSRFADALRAILVQKIGSSGQALHVEQAVERILAKARNPGAGGVVMTDVDQAIQETLPKPDQQDHENPSHS